MDGGQESSKYILEKMGAKFHLDLCDSVTPVPTRHRGTSVTPSHSQSRKRVGSNTATRTILF